MTTSKGTIQGYNGVAAVDKKHQIIVDAQAFGEGQEHHTLQPVIEAIKSRYQQLNISTNVDQPGMVITADTGFANEANMKYLYLNHIDAYIPDNQFRSRDPKFAEQKQKYGKRHQGMKKSKRKCVFPAARFEFDPVNHRCRCPAGHYLSLRAIRQDPFANDKAYFEGRLMQCRHCQLKHQCMENPASANHRKGNGRQVSFIIGRANKKPRYTDWMKQRVDSDKGKHIYSHRMSVVEPVFANISVQKRLNRFSLRGKKKVQSQWRLFCLVHNIEKLMGYGQLDTS